VLNELKTGFRAHNTSVMVGLAASRLSPKVHFSLPPNVGPEVLTLRMNDSGHITYSTMIDVEWFAIQIALEPGVQPGSQLFIDSHYFSPNSSALAADHFVRIYADNGSFRDGSIKRVRIPTDLDNIQKYVVEAGYSSPPNKIYLLLFYPAPPRELTIRKLQVFRF
jgi:hypothetical protein